MGVALLEGAAWRPVGVGAACFPEDLIRRIRLVNPAYRAAATARNHGNVMVRWLGPQRCHIAVVGGTAPAGTTGNAGITGFCIRALTGEEPHPGDVGAAASGGAV